MERVTIAQPGGLYNIRPGYTWQAVAQHLAAYEDFMERFKMRSIEDAERIFHRVNDLGGTDLMAQYKNLGTIDRLRELAKADREGLVVLLPCQNWLDIVFGEQEIFYGIDMDYIENPVREISVENSERFTWYDGWKTVVIKGTDENGLDWEFGPTEIGKTVFLTREEAEAALKGENHEADPV